MRTIEGCLSFVNFKIFLLSLMLVPPAILRGEDRGTEEQANTEKIGGICFRIDDDKPAENWQSYAAVFRKYNFNFSFAINFSPVPDLPGYRDVLARLQDEGDELMDHTPDHATHYFSAPNAAAYNNQPGVDHVLGNKVCLAYTLDPSAARRVDGIGTIDRGCLVSSTPGAFANFISKGMLYIGVYLPTTNRIYGVGDIRAANPLDADTLQLLDFWGDQTNIDNASSVAYTAVTQYEAGITPDGLELMAERALQECQELGLRRPTTWIQPGGRWPVISRRQQTSFYNFGYTSGSGLPDASIKCFNEWDPDNNKRYGMQWGDFTPSEQWFKQMQANIADKVAKHYVLIGGDHFSNYLGTWNDYLQRTDSILAWCRKYPDKIRVKTQTEWSSILYEGVQNPYTNIFPPLNVDLDANGVPDGYVQKAGYTDGILDPVSGPQEGAGYCYSISKKGSICYVTGLAGVEKGENDFYLWTKGAPGDSVEVWVSFTEKTLPAKVFKFPATASVWTRYGLAQSVNGLKTLNIPDDVSLLDVRIFCSNYKGGTVSVGGFVLRKKIDAALKIVSLPQLCARTVDSYRYKIETAAQFRDDTLHYEISAGPSWLQIDQSGALVGTTPALNGTFPIKIICTDQHGNADSQSFSLSVQKRRLLQINADKIAFGNISFRSSCDTLISLTNVGADTVSITDVRVSDSTQVQLSLLSNKVPPQKSIKAKLRFNAKQSGSVRNGIVIYSDAENSPDSISVSANVGFLTDTSRLWKGPENFLLYQNYPNPFNPTTSIDFSLGQKALVRITISDILGRPVRRLIASEEMIPGVHHLTWDGRDDDHVALASGIYVLSVHGAIASSAKIFDAAVKMMLVK